MWIALKKLRRSARYDAQGNIILSDDAVCAPQTNASLPSLNADVSVTWNIIEPPSPDDVLEETEGIPTRLEEQMMTSPETPSDVRENLTSVRHLITEDVFLEGLRQYRASIVATKPFLADMGDGVLSLWRGFLRFLTQPVWVPSRKKKAKQVSRGMLFVQDIVRFGGTFAVLFLFLFLSLNYQSFWEIARARVLPILDGPSIGSMTQDLAGSLQEKLKMLPGLTAAGGGGTEGDLLSVLPQVGPPDNRLVIPKLDLNVPLVNPSFDALLRGDWNQVEQDIQTALQDGVVHYPGTANPGQAGNFFVTGHSSYYPWSPGKYKTVFARLSALDEGDEFWVYFNGDRFRYIVRTKKEVSPSDVTVLNQPTDQRISTLMTCTPVGTTLRRLIIVSEELDPLTGQPLQVGERPTQPPQQLNLESLPI